MSINEKLKATLNQARYELYSDGPRTHLGGSEIGEECDRYLVYKFRWMFESPFDGRMLSLFNRGHREEERCVSWLRQAGFTIYEFQPQDLFFHPESDCYFWESPEFQGDGLEINVTSMHLAGFEEAQKHFDVAKWRSEELAGEEFPPRQQFRISAHNGHFGGSLDGIGYFPESWNDPNPFLLEFKTYATKPFSELTQQGMINKSPKHWAQTCVYGSEYQLQNVLYLPVNKNDDDIHPEFLALDWQFGQNQIVRAGSIINAIELPARISENSTFFKCKFCDANKICHKGHIPSKNCRSCHASQPVENKEWFCHHWNKIIPKDFIPQGCDSWEPFI